MNLEEKMEELSKQIELSFGFEELRTILNNFEEDKMWKANQELIRQDSVESQLHTIQEGGIGNDFGTAISEDLRNGGDQSALLEPQETNIEAETLENVEPGGGEATIVEDFEWVVGANVLN